MQETTFLRLAPLVSMLHGKYDPLSVDGHRHPYCCLYEPDMGNQDPHAFYRPQCSRGIPKHVPRRKGDHAYRGSQRFLERSYPISIWYLPWSSPIRRLRATEESKKFTTQRNVRNEQRVEHLGLSSPKRRLQNVRWEHYLPVSSSQSTPANLRC